jgi:hypothetical protein
MQTRIKLILVVFLLVGVFGCKSDEDPTPSAQELAFAKLVGNWTFDNGGHILVDGQDVAVNYPGFRLSFTNGGYSTINAGALFKSSGIWSWANDTGGIIDLDDGKSISIVNLTETAFNFTFQFAGTGGTANGVAGSYNILLVK